MPNKQAKLRKQEIWVELEGMKLEDTRQKEKKWK